MRTFLLSLIGLTMMTNAEKADASPLDDLRWTKRVLLVFASRDADAGAEQTAELAAVPPEALAERDLLVLGVPAAGRAEPLFGTAGSFDAGALRAAYDVPAGAPFTVVLLGKDGGVKWRETRPAKAEALFRLIDAMPMRAREMRKG